MKGIASDQRYQIYKGNRKETSKGVLFKRKKKINKRSNKVIDYCLNIKAQWKGGGEVG